MNTPLPTIAEVVTDVPLAAPLDFSIPEPMLSQIALGVKVHVSIRGRQCEGYVLCLKSTSLYAKLKPITAIASETPPLLPFQLKLAAWLAEYYNAPLFKILKSMIPSTIRKQGSHKEQLFVSRAKTREELRQFCETQRNKFPKQAQILDQLLLAESGMFLSELLENCAASRSSVETLVKKGLLSIALVRVDRSPLVGEEYFRTKPKLLTAEQQLAYEKITENLDKGLFQTHLLYGVTGSGKTEVYLQIIDKALTLGKEVIMLVPEISLTPQTVERFRSRFDSRIAILHHRLSDGERFDEWHRIAKGEASIVIGARSAIFSPCKNLGLIIVDEEHEPAYKQSEEAPCYHARDVAVMLGKLTNSAVILGSATPSLESYYNAQQNKYQLHLLAARPTSASLPAITLVDLRKEQEKTKGAIPLISDPVIQKIKEKAALGEQSILFLNRRGYHTTLLCKSCGDIVHCEQCDVSLTFHRGENILACHLCGFAIAPPPKICKACGSEEHMKYRGAGTEQVERTLHAILPEIRTMRMDADTTRHKGSHQKMFREFGTGKADVLIGTQMVAKGLHFPQVTFVGVLSCDSTLNIPDFRSAETAFQLLTQVAGRAGRGALKGEVYIQTFMPENETIGFASQQNYPGFYQSEIAVRECFQYPPFTRLVKVLFTGPDEEAIRQFAELVHAELLKALPPSFELQALVPAGHAKIKNQFRFQFIIKGKQILFLNKILNQILLKKQLPKQSRVFIDVDPMGTFF